MAIYVVPAKRSASRNPVRAFVGMATIAKAINYSCFRGVCSFSSHYPRTAADLQKTQVCATCGIAISGRGHFWIRMEDSFE